jgi:hypothetical protein
MIEGLRKIVELPDGVAVAQTAVEPVVSSGAEPAAATGVGTSPAAADAGYCCAVQSDANNEARTQVEQASPVPAGKETGAASRELQDALAFSILLSPALLREDSLDVPLRDAGCP